MKKVLFILIMLCLGLTGCDSSIEEERVNSSIEEQFVISEEINIAEKEVVSASVDVQATSDEEYENQENYIEVDIADLADKVKYFSDGKGWYHDISSETWKCIDVEGNLLFSLPYGYEPQNGFIQNFCIIQREGYKDIVVDESGNQVFLDFSSDDNDILMLSENNGVINLWVRTIKDTYDGHSEMLRIIDGDGTTISEYLSLPGLPFDSINVPGHSHLRFLGDGMYQCGGYVFNSNNNSCFHYENRAGLIEDVLNFEDGFGIGKDGNLIDSDGNVCIPWSNDYSVGKYGNGLYFVGYREEIFISGKYYDTYRGKFYNAEGQVELDISKYLLMRIPFFKGGYCILEILNEAGVEFITVMDKNGEFLFEPVKGSIITTTGYEDPYDAYSIGVSEGVIVISGDLIQMYDLEQNTASILSDNFTRIGAFHNGWAAFDMGYQGMVGFIDKNGDHLKIKLPINIADS